MYESSDSTFDSASWQTCQSHNLSTSQLSSNRSLSTVKCHDSDSLVGPKFTCEISESGNSDSNVQYSSQRNETMSDTDGHSDSTLILSKNNRGSISGTTTTPTTSTTDNSELKYAINIKFGNPLSLLRKHKLPWHSKSANEKSSLMCNEALANDTSSFHTCNSSNTTNTCNATDTSLCDSYDAKQWHAFKSSSCDSNSSSYGCVQFRNLSCHKSSAPTDSSGYSEQNFQKTNFEVMPKATRCLTQNLNHPNDNESSHSTAEISVYDNILFSRDKRRSPPSSSVSKMTTNTSKYSSGNFQNTSSLDNCSCTDVNEFFGCDKSNEFVCHKGSNNFTSHDQSNETEDDSKSTNASKFACGDNTLVVNNDPVRNEISDPVKVLGPAKTKAPPKLLPPSNLKESDPETLTNASILIDPHKSMRKKQVASGKNKSLNVIFVNKYEEDVNKNESPLKKKKSKIRWSADLISSSTGTPKFSLNENNVPAKRFVRYLQYAYKNSCQGASPKSMSFAGSLRGNFSTFKSSTMASLKPGTYPKVLQPRVRPAHVFKPPKTTRKRQRRKSQLDLSDLLWNTLRLNSRRKAFENEMKIKAEAIRGKNSAGKSDASEKSNIAFKPRLRTNSSTEAHPKGSVKIDDKSNEKQAISTAGNASSKNSLILPPHSRSQNVSLVKSKLERKDETNSQRHKYPQIIRSKLKESNQLKSLSQNNDQKEKSELAGKDGKGWKGYLSQKDKQVQPVATRSKLEEKDQVNFKSQTESHTESKFEKKDQSKSKSQNNCCISRFKFEGKDQVNFRSQNDNFLTTSEFEENSQVNFGNTCNTVGPSSSSSLVLSCVSAARNKLSSNSNNPKNIQKKTIRHPTVGILKKTGEELRNYSANPSKLSHNVSSNDSHHSISTSSTENSKENCNFKKQETAVKNPENPEQIFRRARETASNDFYRHCRDNRSNPSRHTCRIPSRSSVNELEFSDNSSTSSCHCINLSCGVKINLIGQDSSPSELEHSQYSEFCSGTRSLYDQSPLNSPHSVPLQNSNLILSGSTHSDPLFASFQATQYTSTSINTLFKGLPWFYSSVDNSQVNANSGLEAYPLIPLNHYYTFPFKGKIMDCSQDKERFNVPHHNFKSKNKRDVTGARMMKLRSEKEPMWTGYDATSWYSHSKKKKKSRRRFLFDFSNNPTL